MQPPADMPGDAHISPVDRQALTDLPTKKMPVPVPRKSPGDAGLETADNLPSETRKHRLIHIADVPTTKTRLNLAEALAARNSSTASLVVPLFQDKRTPRQKWLGALKKIAPVYIAIHIALMAVACLAFLFTQKDFSPTIMPVATLWQQWNHWDTAHYINIAQKGYYSLVSMAFFPLLPLLERGGMYLTGSAFTAGLIVSNLAELVMFVVLYRLVEEDFNGEQAFHTVLYLAIFPTAFFFSAAYTESLFLCMSTLTFYQVRRGRWGWAGLSGLLATLTRPDGLFLLIPFGYEYFCRIWERQGRPRITLRRLFKLLTGLRLSIFFALCMPLGIGVMFGIGYYRFHDLLAFVHSHKAWNRTFHFPGLGVLHALSSMYQHGFLSFITLRTALDLGADLLMFALLVLSFIGRKRLPPRLWAYNLYALTLFIYFQAYPKAGTMPLESLSRFLLELFPAIIILASLRKNRTVHLTYTLLSTVLLFFLAVQFLMGHWSL